MKTSSPPKRKKLDAPLHAAVVLDDVLRILGASPERARLVQLWNNWGMVMGPLASLALPLGTRGDMLLLGAPDSMALQEIHLQSEEILERVNAFMDGPLFAAVNLSLCFDKTILDAKHAGAPRLDSKFSVES
ncbi:MAG: DUF721 domain-containing protein [Desulfovibrio sp.]|jgi:hypothetical protein|nr:DUF721 domain-containing protein [Desulfovibrio sp.]